MKKLLTLLVFLSVITGCQSSPPRETGFLDRTITFEGNPSNYQVYLPRDYNSEREWPVILFLHGAGERGEEGMRPTHVGLGRAIRFNPERWPAIVVFPQVPDEGNWQGQTAEAAMAALDATLDEFSGDESRVYLTGLSLGGNGTWYLGYHHADRFAALLAICGFVGLEGRFPTFVPDSANPYAAVAGALADKPVWIVHGDADVVVPVEESRAMNRELQRVGAEVHYTELPGVNHNSWDAAYSDQQIIDWLFGKRL